ncbi:CIC11C00000004304 [Sungouiella intermedia]|uniref:Cytochrome c oxidase subunit 8, mitochondrial n=1 Tax=Sungouiella intermedia TaxID=45354 RepID=A0A1L0B8X0_9ASCO|nr:CIC11C00000004304 [[Candida] intermedia]
MIARIGLRTSRATRATRNFQTSSRVLLGNVYGSPKEGVYSNLPFKVKTKVVPFGVGWWGVMGFFFAFPFLTSYWHMKKAGNI